MREEFPPTRTYGVTTFDDFKHGLRYYCGTDDMTKFRFYGNNHVRPELLPPRNPLQEEDDECICGHIIENIHYLVCKEDNTLLHCGCECIKRFLGGMIRKCVRCNARTTAKDFICPKCKPAEARRQRREARVRELAEQRAAAERHLQGNSCRCGKWKRAGDQECYICKYPHTCSGCGKQYHDKGRFALCYKCAHPA